MASVKVDVPVDSAEFDKFVAAFGRYQQAFSKQPDVWKAVAGSAEESKAHFAEAADSMRGLAEGLDSVLGRTRTLEDSTKRTVGYWERLGRATKQVSGSVKSTTSSLFGIAKWAGITAFGAGLGIAAGGAALYGVDRLGHAVASNRTTALGLGTTYGGLASARANYARFGDADAALARINRAQTDLQDPGRRGFAALGIKDYETRDSADLLAEITEKGAKFAHDTPHGFLQNRLDNTGVGVLLGGINEAQRLGHDPSEAAEQAGKMRGDRAGLELGADAQRQWTEFSTQLGRAGSQIETVLVNRLVALAPSLSSLSQAVTHLASEALKKDGPISQWLGELNTGLETLAGEIDKPEFQTRVRSFVHSIGEIAAATYGFGKKIAELAHWFAGLIGSDDVPTGSPGTAGDDGGYYGGRRGFSNRSSGGGNNFGGKVDLAGISAVDKTIPAEGRALLDTLASGEAKGYNVLNGGATFSDYSHHPGGRAAGRYQDLPSTWAGIQRQTGLKDFSPESQDKGNWFLAQRDYKARTGRDLLGDLKTKDPERIRAIGRVLHPTWVSLNDSFEPKYEKFKGRLDAPPPASAPTKVTIQKNTGANPVNQVGAMAAP